MKKILIITVLLMLYGCKDEDFTPVSNYEKKLVVYCILDSKKSEQIIRIQKSQPEPMLEGDNHIPGNLEVKIVENNMNTYIFKEKPGAGSDNYSVYYSAAFEIKSGTYILMINSNEYPMVWGTVNVPSKPEPEIRYKSNILNINLGKNLASKGFLYHFFIDYIADIDGLSVSGRMEVPSSILISDNTPDTSLNYPWLIERKLGDDEGNYELMELKNFTFVKNYIQKKTINGNFKWSCTLVISNLDWNFFDYLQSVHGFMDPYSVRLDQPLFSTVSGGYGVFGAINTDSVDVLIF